MNWTTLLVVFGFSLAVFAICMIAMAIGYLFNRKQLTGSCGGLGSETSEDGSNPCSLCTNPSSTCDQLARRMSQPNRRPNDGRKSEKD